MYKALLFSAIVAVSTLSHAAEKAPIDPSQKDLFGSFDHTATLSEYKNSLTDEEVKEVIRASRGTEESFQETLDSFGPNPALILSALVETRWDISGERSLQILSTFIRVTNDVAFEKDATRYQLYNELKAKSGFKLPWTKPTPNTIPE